jgi:hypothetical protein
MTVHLQILSVAFRFPFGSYAMSWNLQNPSRLSFSLTMRLHNHINQIRLMAKEVIVWGLQVWWVLKMRHLLHGILSRKGQHSFGYMWVGIVCMDYQLSNCRPSLASALIEKYVKHNKDIILYLKLSAFKQCVDNMKIWWIPNDREHRFRGLNHGMLFIRNFFVRRESDQFMTSR